MRGPLREDLRVEVISAVIIVVPFPRPVVTLVRFCFRRRSVAVVVAVLCGLGLFELEALLLELLFLPIF